jgi:Immunity protein Imm1
MTAPVGFWYDTTEDPHPAVLDDMLAFHSGDDARPQVWKIVLETEDQGVWGDGPAVDLEASLDGDRGYLRWSDRSGVYVLNPQDSRVFVTEPVAYYDPHGTPGAAPVRHHVNAITVVAAVSQSLRTGRRPTMVAWMPSSVVAAST